MDEARRVHRTDIDGLRAVAVGAVVAYHMGVPRFGAGFIGVDVFFVLSGFLITGILTNEADTTGTIRIGHFYTRRLRRLLPASTLTVLATLLASVLLLSALSWQTIATTSVAAALYASNLFFAAESANYFAADVRTNPLLHYWSLAVEEQFYVVWPLLILLLSRLSPRWRSSALGLIAVASLAHSIALTTASSPWAYYSPFSRAWEFAFGGIVALVWPAGLRGVHCWVREATAWGGLGLLGCSMLLIDSRTAFPGLAAVPTVVGTCLVIMAALDERSPLRRVLDSWPMQEVGRLSYSWYLWHWPFLVIGQIHFDSTAPALRIALVLTSLVVAALTHHLVENPVRFAPPLVNAHRPNWIMSVALVVVILVASVGVDRWAEDELTEPPLAALVGVRDDVPLLLGRDCNVSDLEYLLDRCSLGPSDAENIVLVLGDSHAEMWTPALAALADDLDLRITMHALGGCNVVGVRAPISADYCSQVQENNFEVIDALDPDVVIISHFARNLSEIGAEPWRRALAEFLTRLDTIDTSVGWIHDPPSMNGDPVECVARSGAAECVEPSSVAAAAAVALRDLEGPLLDAAGVLRFDPLPLFCTDTICPLRANGIFRFRDDHHITATYAASLADELEPFVRELLDTSSP